MSDCTTAADFEAFADNDVLTLGGQNATLKAEQNIFRDPEKRWTGRERASERARAGGRAGGRAVLP